MRQFTRRFRLGYVEKIQIGRHANQHALHEVQSDQGVDLSRFLVRIEKDRHGQRHEPEGEQQVVDPGDGHRWRQIVVNGENLRHHPQRVGQRCQPPERQRHALGPTAGRHDSIDQHRPYRQLNQVRDERPGGIGPERSDRANVHQPQQAGNGHGDARALQSSLFRQCFSRAVFASGSNRNAK